MKKDFLLLIGFFVAWRIAIFALSIWGVNSFGVQEFPSEGIRPLNYNYEDFDYGKALNSQTSWDGWQYISISQDNFEYEYQYAFFPMLPKLIAGLTDLTGINPAAAGLILTNIFLLLAIIYIYKLVALDSDTNTAMKVPLLLLVFPGSFFFGMVYTESLFLLFSVLCFYYFRKEKFLLVFIFGLLLALTRNLGVLICIPLFYAYLTQYRKIKPSILALSGAPIGLAAWMTYLYITTGEFFKFVTAQSFFFRETSPNIFKNFWTNLVETSHNYVSPTNVIEIASVLFAVTLIILAIVKKERKEYLIWSVLLLLVPLTQNLYDSINRYVIVIFPLFIYLAKYLKSEAMVNIYYLLAMAGFSISTILFATFRWAG